jgi:hypothetical protein
MASIKLKGDTSGEVTISAPSVAGTTTLELPATSSTLATQNSLGVRNLIINGDMRIAQRGTSVTGITSSSGTYYTVDRFGQWLSGAGTWTHAQDTDVPTGQGFANSVKLSCTTANASLSATAYYHSKYTIEAQNLQHLKYGTSSAEKITLSFWVKSNKTGTYILELEQDDSSKVISQSYTISSADTWEKKTLTYDGNTADVINNDNGRGIHIWFWFAAGSNFTSGTLNTSWNSRTQANDAVGQVNLADSTSNYINITGVQLEVGTEATPFEHRPYDMELQRCMRYYERTPNYGTALASASYTGVEWTDIPRDKPVNYAIKDVRFQVRKRAAATINFSSLNGTAGQMSNVYTGADIGNTNAIWGGERGFTFRNGTGGTISASSHNGIAVSWEASAEL